MKNIGLFGLGAVGQGLVTYLNSQPQLPYQIAAIVVKNKGKKRFQTHIPITTNADAIWNNPSIDIIVEAIDDAEAAFSIAQRTLRSGKTLITANKKMLAIHLSELIDLEQQTGNSIFYEAAVGGSIPILSLLADYYRTEPLMRIRGILNGTSNYVLTKIFKDKTDYQSALQKAQELGFAEHNPHNDVSGKDAWYKTKLLAYQAFGVDLPLEKIFHYGIEYLTSDDIHYARSKSKRIKLVPMILPSPQGLCAWVLPQFMDDTDPLYHVDNENNMVEIEGQYVGLQHLLGKGAGAMPTASALIGDLQRLDRPYIRLDPSLSVTFLPPSSLSIEVYIRDRQILQNEYLRFDSVGEGYLDDSYHYLVGYIPLQRLLQMKSWLEQQRCTVVATGKYRLQTAKETRHTLKQSAGNSEILHSAEA